MHFFCVPRTGLLQCKNHRQVGTHKFRVHQSRHDQFHTHSTRSQEQGANLRKRFFAERELSDLYLSSRSGTVQTVSAQSRRIRFLRLQEPTSRPPLPRIRNDVLCRNFPPSGPTSTKKRHMDLFPHDGQILFLSSFQHGAVLTLENTENAARTRGSSRRSEPPSRQGSFFIHLLCSNESVFVEILLPSAQPYHSGYFSFSASVLHFRAELARRRSCRRFRRYSKPST